MSLFGGDDSAPQSPLSSEDEPAESPTFTAPAISSWSDVQVPDNAQSTRPISYAFDADDEANDDELDSESESELDPGEESSRPNHFTGTRTTWQDYTTAERGLAASLDQIQSGNLAAHLFNAHALKRRVRLPADQLAHFKDWHGKESWLKKGNDLQHKDSLGDIQTELVPLKRWTAWPLALETVPMPYEKFGRRRSEEELDGWVIGGLGEEDPGEELREEILAVILRVAKDQFESREDGHDDIEDVRESRSISRTRSRSRSKSVRSKRSPSSRSNPEQLGYDVEMQDGEAVKVDEDSASESGQSPKTLIDRRHNKKLDLPYSKPTILADDDKARRILQPTINSLLGQLDGVAAAIRRTRLNHFGRGLDSDTSGSEGVTDAGSTSAGSSRSRSRSVVNTKSKSKSKASSRVASAYKTRRKPKNQNNSRKKPLRDCTDSDDASDYGAEFEAEQELQSDESDGPPPKRARSRSKGAENSDSSFMDKKTSTQIGLMDWSEVLGIASMTGWNERAIARTAQRCATLFGEGMSFRSLDEGLATKPASEPIHYNASTIPGPDSLNTKDILPEKRPFFPKGSITCPHTDCTRHKDPFPISYRVIQHIQRVHGYDPRENDSDNEQGRKYGGVHTDGFLLPINARQGWLGGGRAKSSTEQRPHRMKGNAEKEEKGSEPPVLVKTSPVEYD
ncbi:hypothetical protein K504DRAFT_379772 [Pleomassaria siparia CBS 279.74]|uniref:Rrn9 domain-containing protein n=1 Tax=Pleomassaria siparia CBS 279.74 TaxID=1314801 RepID=A0A6G1KAD0_9PLEO|nr:hypothetical protein K504DRAFT_379772 [Pleomassaria siparia CBS 279.74]